MPKYLLAVILTLSCLSLRAQTWEAGASAGQAGYMGDLNQRNPLKLSGPSAGVFVKRNFNPYLSVKFAYNFGRISGADSLSKDPQIASRNLSFTTKLHEVALITEFNFLKYTPGADENRFTPFIYLGIGAVHYNPQATYQGQVYDLISYGTEGQSKSYSPIAISIPYGAGLKYNFTGKWNIMADIGYRNPTTDYLDDVSGNYAGRARFVSPIAAALSDRSGEKTGIYTGAAGTQRGDGRKRDTYLFVNFTLSFTFVTANCYY